MPTALLFTLIALAGPGATLAPPPPALTKTDSSAPQSTPLECTAVVWHASGAVDRFTVPKDKAADSGMVRESPCREQKRFSRRLGDPGSAAPSDGTLPR